MISILFPYFVFYEQNFVQVPEENNFFRQFLNKSALINYTYYKLLFKPTIIIYQTIENSKICLPPPAIYSLYKTARIGSILTPTKQISDIGAVLEIYKNKKKNLIVLFLLNGTAG